MKKIIAFLSVLLFPIFIFAKEYEVKDINIKLDIKDNYIVLTRDNLNDNSNLGKLNTSKEYIEKIMNEKNIYLDIIKDDVSYEILIVVPKTKLEVNNMNNFTDLMLNDYKDKIIKQSGAVSSDIYKTKQNYIYVDYYDDDSKYYMINYYTIANANGYNFILQKKSAITEEEKKDFKEIIDSVEITILDEYKNETRETQEKIDNYSKNSFNYMNIVWGALIGGTVGLISYIIGVFIRKKKSSV